MSISAQINFGKPINKDLDRDEIDRLICDYISGLLRRGQIGGTEYQWSTIKGEICSFVELSHPKALLRKYHGQWGKESLIKLKEMFGREPEWKVIDDPVSIKFPRLQSAKALVLYTTMFEYINCVYTLDTKKEIPLYQLPLKEQEIQDVSGWISSYKLHDEMWIHSGKLEIPAYKQLVEVDSELNQGGRDLCSTIEKATRIPTYYHLMRYWGHKKGEENRKCPKCRNNWRNKELRAEYSGFLKFPFICTKCRLVSYFPSSFDNERYAKIGK